MVSFVRIALGATTLLALVANSVQDCSAIVENVDYYGNDITSTVRASANDCCADCEATVGCKLFVYNGGRCWLKHSKGAQSVAFGARAATVAPAGCTAFEDNTDYYGNDIKGTKRDSAEECCSDCQATDGCKLFVYNGGYCWLKHTKGERKYSQGARASAVKRTMSTMCSGFEENTDYYGNDIKGTKRDSAEECCSDCQATDGCKLFVYNGGYCWLKHTKGQRMYSQSARASIMQPPATPGCSTFEENTDYYGNDIKGTKRDSAEECCADCQATDGCKLFVYNGGYCWLKHTKGERKYSLGARASFMTPTVGQGCGVIEENTDYYGNDIKGTKRDSAEECCADCQSTEGCKLFVYNGGYCWLKHTKGERKFSLGARAVIAVKTTATPTPIVPSTAAVTPAPTTKQTPAPTASQTPAPTP
ncbi:hypothetical protein ACHHYP_13982, partial [Achlya hypogyna]